MISTQTKTKNDVVSIEIQDWELRSDEYTASKVSEDCKTKFSATFEFDESDGSILFSIADKNLENLPCKPLHGLSGIIEIRNGAPSISLGIHPDETILSVMSNGTNQLAVVPENSDQRFYQGRVKHTPQQYSGILFDRLHYNNDIDEYRKELAAIYTNKKFGSEICNKLDWYKGNQDDTVVAIYLSPKTNKKHLAVFQFSNRSVGEIISFKFNAEKEQTNNTLMSALLTHICDEELTKAITENESIKDIVMNNENNSLWDNSTISKAISRTLGFDIDTNNQAITSQLFLFFNNYDEARNTYTCGNTTYHKSISLLTLLSSTDRVVLKEMGCDSDADISAIRKDIYFKYTEDFKFATSSGCTNINEDGSCGGHIVNS